MKLRCFEDRPASFRILRWRSSPGRGTFRHTTFKQDILPLENDDDMKKRIADKLVAIMGQDPHLQSIANLRGLVTITALNLPKEDDDD